MACAALCGCLLPCLLLSDLLLLGEGAGWLMVPLVLCAAALAPLALHRGPSKTRPAAAAPLQHPPPHRMLSRPEDWRYLAETFGGLGDAADMALGCAEVLTAESRALPLDRRAEFSQALLDNCRTVSALARELAGLLRLAEGALALAEQQIDAADLAEVAVTRCMHAAERDDITVTANLLDGIELRGDSLRLRQALENLIRHAMASGGAGALGLRMARSAGGGLAFIVSYEARPDPPGGLGLPVARQIALLHGGDVTSTPAQAHETELRLILPAPRVTWPQTAGRSSSSAA